MNHNLFKYQKKNSEIIFNNKKMIKHFMKKIIRNCYINEKKSSLYFMF